ncbi:(2,3-dihydroxybenzoyl)adenylate synthase [Sphaerisporangium dianthi]|uniref:(2,3-dihydroxybenzoyl)adenylate synthase n=1 Tax=Sphaerisporangium dianthi TaxID=1436120 RepID=A0ABV9CTX5_9ACTN
MNELDWPRWPNEVAAGYRRDGLWTGETFGEVLRARAREHPDRVALAAKEGAVTYGALDRRADRLCAALAGLGLRRGDRVLVQLPNIVELGEVLFALLRLGAVPVLALPPLRSSELVQLGEISEASAYFVAARAGGFDYRKLAREVRDRVPSLKHVIVVGDAEELVPLRELDAEPVDLPGPDAQDLAVLQLSGGTTAVPKLIPRTHADYLYCARVCRAASGFDSSSVYLAALPAVHNFPLISPGVLGALDAGARAVLAPLPSPDVVFPLIESEKVTHTSVVPPLALIWLNAAASGSVPGHDLSSLRVLQVGGAKCSAEVARRIRPTLGCTLQQAFGMAEGLINFTRLDDPDEAIVWTQGRPISPADEIRVVDDEDRDVPDGEPGHLLARGPYTIRGYYRAAAHNARAFTADGFYRTGDVVSRRADGNLVVEGRAKDQINRGGEKIAPEEVENHLLAHPSVFDASVVSMPDEYLGERACAYVVPHGEPPAPRELLGFLRGRGLAAYKIPDRVEFVSELPQTGVGKISKKDLRDRASARAAGVQEVDSDTVKL